MDYIPREKNSAKLVGISVYWKCNELRKENGHGRQKFAKTEFNFQISQVALQEAWEGQGVPLLHQVARKEES